MSYNPNSGYGRALLDAVHSIIPTFGRVFVVCSSSDYADPNYQKLQEVCRYDETGILRFFTSLESAYAAATSNNNDVILLDGHSTHTIANGIAWSKSRIHLIGMDGGGRLCQQGAKVQSTSGVGDAYVIKVTGTRNSFRNVKFIQADTTNTSLTCAQFGGEGTLCENCSFTFGTAANMDGSETTTYEVVMGEDSGTFKNCVFGQHTLMTTGARAVMLLDGVTSGQEMKECIFENCYFRIATSSASADLIRVADTSAVKYAQVFDNCKFVCALLQSGTQVACDDAVRSVSGLVEGNLLFINPASNCTEFCTDVTNQVKVIGPAMDGTNPDQKIGIALTPA